MFMRSTTARQYVLVAIVAAAALYALPMLFFFAGMMVGGKAWTSSLSPTEMRVSEGLLWIAAVLGGVRYLPAGYAAPIFNCLFWGAALASCLSRTPRLMRIGTPLAALALSCGAATLSYARSYGALSGHGSTLARELHGRQIAPDLRTVSPTVEGVIEELVPSAGLFRVLGCGKIAWKRVREFNPGYTRNPASGAMQMNVIYDMPFGKVRVYLGVWPPGKDREGMFPAGDGPSVREEATENGKLIIQRYPGGIAGFVLTPSVGLSLGCRDSGAAASVDVEQLLAFLRDVSRKIRQ